MNSPQSQKDAVGSIVERYVKADMTKTTPATILFHRLNFFLSIICISYKWQIYKIDSLSLQKIWTPWQRTIGKEDWAWFIPRIRISNMSRQLPANRKRWNPKPKD